jgi:hypothetical protein
MAVWVEFVAGCEPELTVISRCFRMSYCSVIDLFAVLSSPIVERFIGADQLEYRLSWRELSLLAARSERMRWQRLY